MNIKEALATTHSKENTKNIANFISCDEQLYAELMGIFLGNDRVLAQRAAWVVRMVNEKHPFLKNKYIPEMWHNLKNKVHDAIKRNTLGMFQDEQLPENIQGFATDLCFNFLRSKNETKAIKIYSISVLYQLTLTYPELANELKLVIEELLPYHKGGVKARGMKVLAQLQKKQLV